MKSATIAQRAPATTAKGRGQKPFFVKKPNGELVEEAQPKLRLGRVGDRCEREADRVADAVADGRVPNGYLSATLTPITQRQALEPASAKDDEPESTEESLEESDAASTVDLLQARRKDSTAAVVDDEALEREAPEGQPEPRDAGAPLDEAREDDDTDEWIQLNASADELQAREATDAPPSVPDDVARGVLAAQGSGKRLPELVRQRMEPAFGADFSGVRVHTDASAARLADRLGAEAFTRGGDVFFADARFDPASRRGTHLIAHELTHTIQQGAVAAEPVPAEASEPAAPAPDASLGVSAPDEKSERQPGGERRKGEAAVEVDGEPAPEETEETEQLAAEPADVAGAVEEEAALEEEGAAESPEEVTAAEDAMGPEDVMSPDAVPEPDLTLPPPADAGPAEEVAVVEKVDLSGSSDQATTAFLDATPSSMAVSQPEFGPKVDAAMKGEQKDLFENPPSLVLKTAGSADAGLVAAADLPVPGDTSISDGVVQADPGSLPAESLSTPEPFRGNAERDGEMEQEESGGFWDMFRKFIDRFVNGIRTRDDDIDTSAGRNPKVTLEGEADTTRMRRQKDEGTGKLRSVRDNQVAEFRAHPGQQKIQPREVNEERRANINPEAKASIDPLADDSVAAYAAAPLPQNVRDAADARVAKKLTPNLADARAQTVDAALARDNDKANEIELSQQAAAKLSQETDQAQRTLVVENRGKVAGLQGEGIGEAYRHVNEFSQDATKKQATEQGEINEHVKKEEGAATSTLKQAEKDAETEKRAGEAEAAEKKRQLEKEKKKGGWWSRVKGAIKSAVKAITNAIDKVFTKVRNAVKSIINKAKNLAIGLINKARNWVIKKLNDFRDWATTQVNKYLGDTFPGLARRINSAINSVTDTAIAGVNYVADKAIEGITAIADGLSKALDKILSTFQIALKTAVRVAGAVMQGDFAEGLRAAIEGACEIAGIDPKPVFDFLDRAGEAIGRILRDPVGFLKNLFGAVGGGVREFFKNIKTHLIDGVIAWLTGALGDVNLKGPFEFSPRGIASIVLQILGATYDNIKARVIKKLPAAAQVFDALEQGFAFLRRLTTEGPVAIWDEIRERVTDIKETVMKTIRGWLITTVIKEGIIWLLSLTNPASAIVKVVKLIFQLVMFLVERYNQIKDFIVSVYEAVAEIAAGNFAKVTVAVENALKRALPVLISLVATVLGLGDIAKQVKNVIQAISKPVTRAIDWVVGKIIAMAKKLLKGVKAGARKVKEKAKAAVAAVIAWWKIRKQFRSTDGGTHGVYYAGEAGRAELMVASKGDLVSDFLKAKAADMKAPATERQVAADGLKKYKIVLEHEDELEKLRKKREKVSTSDKAAYREATSNVNSAIKKHRNVLDDLAQVLQRASFELQDDALVRTHVTFQSGATKSAKAMPLTYLSGNEKGSSPSEDPDGWAHAVALDTKPDGSSYHQWVRGHLLNDNLHGPGKKENLVPITQTMNRQMETQIEAPAKAEIKTRGKLFYYEAKVTFWKGSPPIDAFPKRVRVTWGEAEREGKGKAEFKIKKEKLAANFDMADAPPAKATAFVPTINGGSPTLLLAAINKHGTVTSYFVTDVLLAESEDRGKYKKKDPDDMRRRLMKNVEPAFAAQRKSYVDATYAAITAGDIQI